jgi:hypothetical protein
MGSRRRRMFGFQFSISAHILIGVLTSVYVLSSNGGHTQSVSTTLVVPSAADAGVRARRSKHFGNVVASPNGVCVRRWSDQSTAKKKIPSHGNTYRFRRARLTYDRKRFPTWTIARNPVVPRRIFSTSCIDV